MRSLIVLVLIAVTSAAIAQPNAAAPAGGCGELVTIPTHSGTTMRCSLMPAAAAPAQGAPVTLVMLIGGGGYINLDDQGCPRILDRNSLVRMRPLLRDAGVATALVIGHAADNCVRSPASQMSNIIAKTRGARQQAVAVTGGPVSPGRPTSVGACEVREPHDFVEQETEVAAGIVRFMRGGIY